MEQDLSVKLVLRLDEALHQQLTLKAKREVRSLNGQIVWTLRQAITEQSNAAGSRAA